jgi:hypothetical protein
MKKGLYIKGVLFVSMILGVTDISAQVLDTGNVYLPQNGIWNKTGSVGIGTRTPRAYLDVATAGANTTSSVLGRLSEGSSNGSGTYIGIQNFDSQPMNAPSFSIEHRFYGLLNSAITFCRGSAQQGGYITFSTSNGTEKMRLDPNGNLGIGTTTTGLYRLTVEGTTATRRLKVTQQATWADFVFHPDYQLPSLQEVETYINTNKHLSGIPTTEEVQKDGLDIGEMNKLLLQKVEELTLYMIEEHKQKQKMQEVIDELTKAMQELKDKSRVE